MSRRLASLDHRDDRQRALVRIAERIEESEHDLRLEAEMEAMDDPTFRLAVLPTLRMHRRCEARALALAEMLAMLLTGAEVEPTIAPPGEQEIEVAPMVDQLVRPLTSAPAAPPARRVALIAA